MPVIAASGLFPSSTCRHTRARGSSATRSWQAARDLTRSSASGESLIRRWIHRKKARYKFLDRLIGEMTSLFPDAYFHIGGDECNGKEWDANPGIQDFMKSHQMKDDAALQAYFTGHVQQIVAKDHKIAVGWDEVLQPNTPKDVVIQSWRGQESLAIAARQGNRAILSAGYYLDLNEPAVAALRCRSLGRCHSNSHCGAEESSSLAEKLRCGPSSSRRRTSASGIWPRAAAVAERLWSPESVTDEASMYRRLAIQQQRLAWYGLPSGAINQALLQRIGWRSRSGIASGAGEGCRTYEGATFEAL